MLEIKRESGYAIPPARVVYAYPYDEMEVGDSFVVPVASRARVLNANYSCSSIGRGFNVKDRYRVIFAGRRRIWC